MTGKKRKKIAVLKTVWAQAPSSLLKRLWAKHWIPASSSGDDPLRLSPTSENQLSITLSSLSWIQPWTQPDFVLRFPLPLIEPMDTTQQTFRRWVDMNVTAPMLKTNVKHQNESWGDGCKLSVAASFYIFRRDFCARLGWLWTWPPSDQFWLGNHDRQRFFLAMAKAGVANSEHLWLHIVWLASAESQFSISTPAVGDAAHLHWLKKLSVYHPSSCEKGYELLAQPSLYHTLPLTCTWCYGFIGRRVASLLPNKGKSQ